MEDLEIKFIYHYDEITKEYLQKTEVEADPEETIIRGYFVPLIPDNGTLIEIPKYEKNEIPVFKNEKWVVEKDYRENFYKVDNDFLVTDITTIGEQEGFIVVEKSLGEQIKQEPQKFKIIENQIIPKTEQEYQEYLENQEKLRIAQLHLTAADVERGIYKAKGMDFDDIMAFVMANPPKGLDVKALKIELKANNFYRGNPYVEAIGKMLGFTDEQLNLFFEDGDYKHLLPKEEVLDDSTTDKQPNTNADEVQPEGDKLL